MLGCFRFLFRRRRRKRITIANCTKQHVCIITRKHNYILPVNMARKIKLSKGERVINVCKLDGHDSVMFNVFHKDLYEIHMTWSWEEGYNPEFIVN